jgi:hypothetical protein
MPRVRVEEVRQRYKTLSESGVYYAFADMVAESIGLQDSHGRAYTREDGAPTLAPKDKRRNQPHDYPFDMLAEGMIGPNWKSVLRLGADGESAFPLTRIMREAAQMQRVSEESAVPIQPSVWANVAAWSATVGGLLQAQFNLGYETEEFELADLFPIRPAVFWQGGERYIDILGPFNPAQLTGPGEEYPDNSMSAFWVEPGPMAKYAGKISLTKEMLSIDISGGQMLSKANNGGWSLKFRENELSLDVLCGQLNNWKLGMLTDTSATGYNTYGATITTPTGIANTITNDIVNPINDLGALQKSNENALLYHPVTNNPIKVDLDVAIFPTPMFEWADAIMAATAMTPMTQTTIGPAQAAPGTFPNMMISTNNPWKNDIKRAVKSRWLDQRQVASTTQTDPNRTAGLGLTGPARYRWYRLNPAKAACRRQMWAPTSTAVNATDYVMLTQGIAAAFVWDVATMVQVLSGYHIQRNKGA